MKKSVLLLGILGSMTLSVAAHAAGAGTAGTAGTAATNATNAKKPIALWECQDLLGVEESYRPVVVGYAEAFNQKGKPEEAAVDVAGIRTLTPMLVQYCSENPKIKLRDALAGMNKK